MAEAALVPIVPEVAPGAEAPDRPLAAKSPPKSEAEMRVVHWKDNSSRQNNLMFMACGPANDYHFPSFYIRFFFLRCHTDVLERVKNESIQ